MNILSNRNERINIFEVVVLCLIAAVSLTLMSCDNDMDIQQSYPFTVEAMPVSSKAVRGQAVEIRCKLKKEGDFSGTLYAIRYLQFKGGDSFKIDGGITLLPNDHYLPENERFHLYYIVKGDEAHSFIVVVEGNFKNPYGLGLDFSNRSIKDDGFVAIPVGSFKRV